MVALILWVLGVVALWKVFQKANIEGWKSLIPFYNDYLLFKIAKRTNLFITYIAVYIINIAAASYFAKAAMDVFSGDTFSGAVSIGIGSIVILVTWAFLIIIRISLSKGIVENFTVESWYFWGLVFIPKIFLIIMGFSEEVQYKGNNNFES